ncbi:MAG TPA: hypothetical protein VEZ42_08760 [Pseudonocardia sp.]|jgi:hypothetical protein|nr:hypothetical protein [Pseudonocardia sp.]
MTGTDRPDLSKRPGAPGAYGAARAYKEVVAGIAEAAEKLRTADQERAAALAVDLVGLERTMMRAGERAALTRLGVELSWEDALEALWVESWMQLRPRPGPAPGADPARLDELDAEVQLRREELLAAVRRRRFGFGRGPG